MAARAFTTRHPMSPIRPASRSMPRGTTTGASATLRPMARLEATARLQLHVEWIRAHGLTSPSAWLETRRCIRRTRTPRRLTASVARSHRTGTPFLDALKLAYVGTHGVHLDDLRTSTPTRLARQLTVNRQYATLGSILVRSRPAGLQLQRAADHCGATRARLSLLASYTYSHALDENTGSPGSVVNPYNIHADYGNSDWTSPTVSLPARITSYLSRLREVEIRRTRLAIEHHPRTTSMACRFRSTFAGLPGMAYRCAPICSRAWQWFVDQRTAS